MLMENQQRMLAFSMLNYYNIFINTLFETHNAQIFAVEDKIRDAEFPSNALKEHKAAD